MDNLRMNISDKDIDARLARYDDGSEYETPYEDQLYKKDDKIKENQYKGKKENEIFEEFSYPVPRFKSHCDRDYSMKSSFKDVQTSDDSKSNSHLLKKDDKSKINAHPGGYSYVQQERAVKQEDKCVDYLYSKVNKNKFHKKIPTSNKNRIPVENQHTEYSCNVGNSNSSSLLNKKELKTSSGFNDDDKSYHYSSDIYDDLEGDKRISSKPSDNFDRDDKNYKFVSTYENGARMKSVMRNLYAYNDSDKSKKSQHDVAYLRQNSSNIGFKEQKNDRLHRSERDRMSKYVSDYSRYSDFKQSKKKEMCNEANKSKNQKLEERRAKKDSDPYNFAGQSDISYSDNAYYIQKHESEFSKRNSNEMSFSKSVDHNLQHVQHENFFHNDKIKSNYLTDFEIGEHSKSEDHFKLNQEHYEDLQDSFKYNIQETSLDNRHMISVSRHRYFDNKHYFKNREENDDIWKRQSACDEETNTDLREITNRRSGVNTYTMHDARRIAPMVLQHVVDSSFEGQDVSQIAEEENMFRNERKCWSRVCWSRTKHSHAVNISQDLHSSKDRNAIMNSMKSPQYAIKSNKKSFTDYWSSLLKTSASRFELWNRTLKKIEGQFGTGVVSYFVFLRWLIFLNFVIFILYFLLIILPYSAFSFLTHQNIKSAPNTSLLTDEYLQQFPKYKDVPFTRKRIGSENVSLNLNLNGDLLSNLGTLLDNYVPDELLDVTIRYSKRNYTGEERHNISLMCEDKYKKIMANHTKETFTFLQDFLQGTGWLQSTILFLGYYPDRDVSYFGLAYNLPVSFLAVFIVSFFLSLVLMVQYSSHGIQENVLTQKSNYLTFSNILFCSWDYCIEDKKTADIRHKSIICEIKSNLAEEHRKSEVSHWSSEKWMRVYALRATINIIIIGALLGSFYLIYIVVIFQLEKLRQNALKDSGAYTLFIQFLPPLVITGLNIIMPIIFYNLVKFEMYNTRTQINIALFRIVFLRLASVFVLVSSLYQQITCEPKDFCRAGISEFCRTPICWETYVGQQLYKLVITDFLVYICMFLAYDLPRDFIVQKCRCKVTEVIGRQVFDIPSQVLSLVYSQTLCWLGLLYSPLLAGISVLKFLIIFYIKKVVVLKHCVPAPVLYKASRSNSIFMTILMISFFVVTMIHGYSLTSIEPSPGCSPFRQYVLMIHAISEAIDGWSSKLVKFMSYVFSGFFFIPASLLVSVVIYYYWTVIAAHKQMTKVLKAQIAVEGRDKQFLLNRLAEAARQATTN